MIDDNDEDDSYTLGNYYSRLLISSERLLLSACPLVGRAHST